MKKKILAMAMVLTLAAAAVGCGSESGNTESSSTEASSAAVTEAKSEGAAKDAAEADTKSGSEGATEGASKEAGNEDADKTFKGVAEGTTYNNTFYGVSFTAPEGGKWEFSDSAELAARVGKTGDEVKAMTFADVKGGKVYPAMMCADMTTGESTSFILSGITAGMSEKDMIDATAKTLESTAEAVVKEGSPIGSTYYTDINYKEGGVTLFMRQFYIFKDETVATITVTSMTEEGRDKLIAGWKNK